MNKEVIKSPLQYSGNKNNLIIQIKQNLPSDFNSFIDVMGGAFNVGANIESDLVVYNEYNTYVYDIVKGLIECDKRKLINYIDDKINEFDLKINDKESYDRFRKHYNENKCWKKLLILNMYSFQNIIRFNNKNYFNASCGKSFFKDEIKENIIKFKYNSKKIDFRNGKFQDEIFDYKNPLFYFDPPYLITNANYNEKRLFEGWSKNIENEMYNYIDVLNKKNNKFMLSNVFEHKGKKNETLKKWVNKNNFNVVELVHNRRKEVLIKNF